MNIDKKKNSTGDSNWNHGCKTPRTKPRSNSVPRWKGQNRNSDERRNKQR